MSSYTLEISEKISKAVSLPMPMPAQSNDFGQEAPKSRRIFGTTVALLNQTQAELDAARKELAILHKKLAELKHLATTDMLTGIKNLRGFNESLYSELDRVRRKKSMGGVLVIIDLNGFKAINNTYGHQAGDMCLKLVGQTLYHDLRKMDTAARLGGDEFVLLLTDTTPEMVAGRVQYIASRLNNLSLIWKEKKIPIFASIGMKPYAFGDKAEDILAAADRAMYADKKRDKEKQSTE